MNLHEFGKLGRLEAARQALLAAGKTGLSSRAIMAAAGLETSSGGGSTQHFLLQLTSYCYLYESDNGRRFYIDGERDATFTRKVVGEHGDIFAMFDDTEEETWDSDTLTPHKTEDST